MATGPKPYVFRVSHEQVIDPESVERGHWVWARYVAERLCRSMGEGLWESKPELTARKGERSRARSRISS